MSSVIKSGSHAIHIEPEHRDSAASGCSTAAIIYGVFFILSIGCCIYAKRSEPVEDPATALKPIKIEDELLAEANRV
jgi:hypothetical protein